MMRKIQKPLALLLLVLSMLLAGCAENVLQQSPVDLGQVDITQFRENQPYVEINGNQPNFDAEDMTTEACQ